jgi:hypothetical protein
VSVAYIHVNINIIYIYRVRGREVGEGAIAERGRLEDSTFVTLRRGLVPTLVAGMLRNQLALVACCIYI